MNILRVIASMDPSMGGPPQGIRNSIGELERLGIRNEVVSCDAADAAWLGRDSFPIHALGPGKYGFAYTPKLGPWLEENLSRFDAVIVHGLWLWPSTCAVRAIARHRRAVTRIEACVDRSPRRPNKWRVTSGQSSERAQRKERKTGHGRVCETAEGKLTRMKEDRSERLAADRTGGDDSSRVIAYGPSTASQPPVQSGGGLSAEGLANSSHVTRHPSLFVMPHGMLDPWFQRDKSRRVKAVRNWFYWWLVERDVVNSADALLFTCQQELALARTTFGGYRPRREINVGYGIAEPPAFEPKMREAFAAKCPDLHGRPYLLFMSRVHAKKNVAALVRAYARVHSEQNKRIFSHSRAERDRQLEELSEAVKLTQPTDRETALRQIDTDKSERLAADRPGENAAGPVTRAGDGQSQQNGKGRVAFPDLVIAGPGWESDYGREVRGLIDVANSNFAQSSSTLDLKLKTSHSAPIHAVGMLSGAAKWGALYGCEAFVLPSHQENFGIAVVEALACGKPVLISDQVNIWREIVEDGAGLVEGDTEEGVEKLLRRFFHAQRAETGGLRPEVGGQSSDFSHGLGKMDEDASERPAADRTGGNAEHRVTSVRGGESSETSDGGPRECYLKRFAIGPAAAKLAEALKGAGVASDW